MKRKFLAALLAALMIFCLFGCDKAPDAGTEAPPPVSEAPPEPTPVEVYTSAREALEALTAVTLEVKKTVTTRVAGEEFVDESTQVVTYAGLDTDAPVIRLEKQVQYQNGEETDSEDKTRLYTEVYAGETLYVELEDEGKLSGPMTEITGRYVPVVLLDETLYSDVTKKTENGQTVISFAAPAEAEVWALPEEALLETAEGSAVLGADGKVQEMRYTVTYTYGSVEVTMELISTPRGQAEQIAAPEDPEAYLPVQAVDAVELMLEAKRMVRQSETITSNFNETIICQAAGMVQTQSVYVDAYKKGDDYMVNVETGIHLSDPTNGMQELTQEENYQNGKYVLTVDDGLPTTSSGVTEAAFEEYLDQLLMGVTPRMQFWEDVTVADLGSTYLLEFTFNEDLGNTMQSTLCQMIFQNPSLLNSYASAYVNKDMTGYLAVDKYTGAITANGMNFEGVHTIDGDDYSLILQKDQSFCVPSYGAYETITEKPRPETEPEQKATPLFYHVTGENGQEMWLLGTIHVGDERTGFLPQEIYDAFAASDALALEIDSDAFDEQVENDEKLLEKVSKAYYYQGETTVADILDEELYTRALQHLKASGNYSDNMNYMKVSMWENAISNFYMDQGHQLTAEQGVEERLTRLAKEQEKPIREVESTLFQIQMLTGWSDDLMVELLKETLDYSAVEYWTGTYELYELWCAGDEEAMREELSTEPDFSEMTEEEIAEYEAIKHLLDEYNKAMSYDRNEGMLDVAIEYLESGDVVFYAVGLAHLLDNTNGLVDTLREAGYTVELVTYAE